jgi:hypothetical protein
MTNTRNQQQIRLGVRYIAIQLDQWCCKHYFIGGKVPIWPLTFDSTVICPPSRQSCPHWGLMAHAIPLY